MNTIVKLTLGAVLISNALIAQADNLTTKTNGFYVSANGGYGMLGDINQVSPIAGGIGSGVNYNGQDSFSYGLNLGYQLSHYRAELAYNRLNNEVKVQGKKEKLKDYSVMLRGIYDIDLVYSKLHPYLGVQLGAYSNDPEKGTGSIQPSLNKGSVFAYGGLVGLKYNVNSHVDVYSELDHLSTAMIKKGNSKYRVNYNSILLGVSYKF